MTDGSREDAKVGELSAHSTADKSVLCSKVLAGRFDAPSTRGRDARGPRRGEFMPARPVPSLRPVMARATSRRR